MSGVVSDIPREVPLPRASADLVLPDLYFLLIIPELSEPPVRTLGATIPENESHIFR